MKKKILYLMILMLALGAAGCSQKTGMEETNVADSAAETAEETKKETESETETKKETESETETESEAPKTEVSTVIGTLEELTEEHVMLLTDNGNELTFAIASASVELPSGIRIGNLVAVDYCGELVTEKEKYTAAVRIVGSADVEKKAPPKKEKICTGSLQKLTMTDITIKRENGQEVTFRTVNTPLYFSSGLSKGMSVRIIYKGKLKEEESESSVEVIRIES